MQYGHFDDSNREYVVTNHETPASWINYLGESDYCAILSHHAGGYSFYESPRWRRLTRMRFNSVPMDRPGRYFYLREAGEHWSLAYQPSPRKDAVYRTRIGLGYNVYEVERAGIRTSTRIFVPLGVPAEVAAVTIENTTDRTRELDLFSYVEFSFFHNDQDLSNYQYILYVARTEFKDDIASYWIRFNPNEIPRAFATTSLPVESFDLKRKAFIGRFRDEGNPIAVERGRCSNTTTLGDNPVAALHSKIRLSPGEKITGVYLLGIGDAMTVGKELKKRLCDPRHVEEEVAKLARHWEERLSPLSVETPDANTNRSINIWNIYQCHTTFNWSRSASFIEAGGRDGVGYRDTFQDILAVVHTSPARVRDKIKTMMRGQAKAGFVVHHFQPLTLDEDKKKMNVEKTYICSDDHLWMTLAIPAYIKETGDTGVLDEKVDFLDGDEETILEHMMKALRFSHRSKGTHGILLGFGADWNDCLNFRNGGESIWTSLMFCRGLGEMIGLLRHLGRSELVTECETMRGSIGEALDQWAWDGEHFLRGFTGSGKKIGSRELPPTSAQIFLNTQSWAVFSGYALGDRGRQGMDKVKEKLASPYGIKLCHPPYTDHDPEIGAMGAFPPGLKENAGIFCHANTWAVIAEAMLGRGDRAFEYYKSYLPMERNDDIDRYEIEPYVYAQFICGPDHPEFGMGRNAWLSGTASWSYVAATQYLLGVRADYEGLVIAPALPTAWSGFTMRRTVRGKKCVIRVSRGAEKGIVVAGKRVRGDLVPYDLLGADGENAITVTI
jgi:N,N'-diacetylchitobiose phosphorylase